MRIRTIMLSAKTDFSLDERFIYDQNHYQFDASRYWRGVVQFGLFIYSLYSDFSQYMVPILTKLATLTAERFFHVRDATNFMTTVRCQKVEVETLCKK
jgi:hypothetical protein